MGRVRVPKWELPVKEDDLVRVSLGAVLENFG